MSRGTISLSGVATKPKPPWCLYAGALEGALGFGWQTPGFAPSGQQGAFSAFEETSGHLWVEQLVTAQQVWGVNELPTLLALGPPCQQGPHSGNPDTDRHQLPGASQVGEAMTYPGHLSTRLDVFQTQSAFYQVTQVP